MINSPTRATGEDTKGDIHFPEESSRLQNVGQVRAACQGVDYCCPLMAA